MPKILATLNTIAWGAFWAFGLLALSTPPQDTGLILTHGLLSVLGAGAGLYSYLYLIRHSEHTGYAKAPNRAV